MKAVKAFGPKDLRVVEVVEPSPGEGEVKIAVKACGICGSDKWFWQVQGPVEKVAGHEASGEVVALGSRVSGLKVGDRVVVNNVKGCGYCEACKAGKFVCCSTIEHMDHGFSEFIVVPERNCILLDDRISFEEGCLIADNWGTPFKALKKIVIKNGDFVIVSGCGPIGLAAIGLVKLKGANIIALDPIEYRRKAAERMGAFKVLAPDQNVVESIRKITGEAGASAMLECSGKPSAYDIGFQCLKMEGSIISIGEGAKFELNVSEKLIRKQLNIRGSFYSDIEDAKEVQELILKRLINPLEIVTHRYSLEEIPQVFGEVFESREGILKTVICINS